LNYRPAIAETCDVESPFCRQLRMDGGYRTGLEVDGETVYGLFEEGQTDDDPRLRWFVDLRCVGSKLPKSARLARAWLLKNSPMIVDGFARCSQEVRAGIDPDLLCDLLGRLQGRP
jgi:hypothetical protein